MVTASHNPNIYNPYLPVMAIFGLPRALLGPGLVTDPRIWFTLGFVAVFAVALAVAGARDVLRWTVLVTATPVIAFSLAVGGTDVPVLALLCLGLALLWRRPEPVVAGLVLGVAAATKATAWPALIVAATMLTVRDGWRAATRFVLAAIAAAAAIITPVAAVWPHSLVENTILFPLGLAKVKSEAVSPLPGHVLADTGPAGHTIAVALLSPGGPGGAGLPGHPAAPERAVRDLAAHHRPGAHVRAGPRDPVRVLHVSGGPVGLAGRVAAGCAAPAAHGPPRRGLPRPPASARSRRPGRAERGVAGLGLARS